MKKQNFFFPWLPVLLKAAKYAVFLGLFTFVAAMLIQNIRDFDIWWHLKTGEYILANGFIPKIDIFSYTVPGHRWVNHQWLADVLLFLIFRGFGLGGIVVLKALVFGAAFFIVFAVCFRKNLYLVSVILTVVAVLASEHRFLERPFMFNSLFLVIYFSILHNFKYKNTKLIFLLPVLQMVWTNLHGGSLMGIILILSYLIGEALQRMKREKLNTLLRVAAAAILAGLINPNGLTGALYPFLTLTGINNSGWQEVIMKYITELQPPLNIYNILKLQPYPYYKLLIFLSLAGFVLNYKRLNPTHLIIYAIFLAFSFKANRNIIDFAILTAPITMLNFESAQSGDAFRFVRETLSKLFGKLSPMVLELLLLLCLIAGMLSLTFIATSPRYCFREKTVRSFGLGDLDAKYPKDAVRFILANNIKGNMFNAYEIGGYLIFRLTPERKVFIDGRTEVYGPKFYKGYVDLTSHPKEFDKVTKGFDINYIILSRIYIDSDALLEYIYNNSDWRLVFFDEISCVFVKNSFANRDIINKYPNIYEVIKQYPAQKAVKGLFPFTLFKKGEFLRIIGLYDEAISVLEEAKNADQKSPFIHYNLGLAYEKKRESDKAIEEFLKVVKANPNHTEAFSRLGLLFYEKGKINDSLKAFRAILRSDSGSAFAYNNIGVIYNAIGNQDKAIKFWRKALRLNPNHVQARLNLYKALNYFKKKPT
ncbi:MAG: tetratricopeptide repeat protein [Candidatus Omnitrophota bacterium]